MNDYRKEAGQVASEARWTFFRFLPLGVSALVIVVAVLFGLKSLGMIGGKMVERQVLVNSHQYIEGMQQRANILTANIAEVDAMISSGQGDAKSLMAQKRALRAQLNAITK